jgi:glycosyltransferase involved in cell wall biosynthesis
VSPDIRAAVSRPLRIAWTGPVSARGGGVPSMGMLMLRELLRQGVEVDLYLNCDRAPAPPIPAMAGLRLIVRRTPWQWNRWYSRTPAVAMVSSLASRSVNGVLLSVRLLIEHRRNPYDAVFQLSQIELFLLGRARRAAPPIVVHPCSHAAGELRWHRREQSLALRSESRAVHFAVRAWLTLRSRLQPRELARADLVIGPSARFVELVHEDCGVPVEKLRILRHPVDLDRFEAAPGAADSPPDMATLLFISRISARKGVEDIVTLSHRLSDLEGSVRLLVIGDISLWSDYTAHLKDLNAKVAEYVGSVASAQMPALMRSAAALLVPSRYEPGSIVTGEALACGLPVVLSDEVGPSEVLAGPHVRVYPAGDVDAFEAAVRSMLAAAAEDRQALADAARADAERHFSASAAGSHLVEMLVAAADGPAARAAPQGAVDRARA